MDSESIDIIGIDGFRIIFSFVQPSLRFPLNLVCKKWREICVNLKGNGEELETWFCFAAAMENYIDLLEWFIQFDLDLDGNSMERMCWKDSEFEIDKLSTAAAIGGHISTLEWIKENGFVMDEMTSSGAAMNGKLDALIWLKRNHCPFDCGVTDWAAWGGHLNVLKWALINDCEWDGAAEWAAKMGHLDVIKWLIDEEGIYPTDYLSTIAQWAGECGQLEVFGWIVKHKGWNTNYFIGYSTAKNGHLDILQHAKKHGLNLLRICVGAAESGNLSILRWAKEENTFDGGPQVLQVAASNGRLEALKFIVESQPINTNYLKKLTVQAAKNGHLHVVRYLIEIGADLDAKVCAYAAKNGDLPMLTFARENNCPWNSDACLMAAQNGQLSILIYLRNNGCPWDERTCTEAARNGNLGTLKFARENDCPWNKTVCSQAAANGHLSVLQWAREHGCPWNWLTCTLAEKNGHWAVLHWAKTHGCDYRKDKIMTRNSLDPEDEYDMLREWEELERTPSYPERWLKQAKILPHKVNYFE